MSHVFRIPFTLGDTPTPGFDEKLAAKEAARKAHLEEFHRRYPHRVDYFASDQAFLDMVEASSLDRMILVSSRYDGLNTHRREEVDRVQMAYAVQDANMGGAYLRVYTVLPGASGNPKVYFATTSLDFWTSYASATRRFVQTSLDRFVFRIDAVPASETEVGSTSLGLA